MPSDTSKLSQMFIDHEYQKYHGVIEALVSIKMTLPLLYGSGVTIPEAWLDKVLEEVIKLEV